MLAQMLAKTLRLPILACKLMPYYTNGVLSEMIDTLLAALYGYGIRTPTPLAEAGAPASMASMAPQSLPAYVADGGYITLIIIVLGCLSCALGIWRIVALARLARAVKRQSRAAQAVGDNPLARVMRAAESSGASGETLEWRLEEACLRETPPLRFGLGALKLCAALLPMLGLLGTVLGMMEAIQSMALAGPTRTVAMATGIGRALVTTVLGLTFAIPVVLLHAGAAAYLSAVTTRLEEYCARTIADDASRHSDRPSRPGRPGHSGTDA